MNIKIPQNATPLNNQTLLKSKVKRIGSPDFTSKKYASAQNKKICLSPQNYTSNAKKAAKIKLMKTGPISKKILNSCNKNSSKQIPTLLLEALRPKNNKEVLSPAKKNMAKTHRKTESVEGYAARAKMLKKCETVTKDMNNNNNIQNIENSISETSELSLDDQREVTINFVKESLKLTSIAEIQSCMLNTVDQRNGSPRKRCSSLYLKNATVDYGTIRKSHRKNTYSEDFQFTNIHNSINENKKLDIIGIF